MLLIIGEIEALKVNGISYSIKTNARYWLKTIKKLETAVDEDERASILLDCVEMDTCKLEKNIINRLLERIQEFYLCAYEKCNDYKAQSNKSNKKLYDFDIDSGRIFSAFYKTYGIDIEAQLDNIHWWKFMAMFNDLSKGTALKGYYMHFRGYDKSSDDYKKASADYKRNIDEQINIVTIHDDNNAYFKEDSPLAKLRKKGKERKE